MPSFTSVSDTARHRLSRAYHLPGAELKRSKDTPCEAERFV